MLTIAVSSRALFHMDDGHKIYEDRGVDAYDAYMRSTEMTPLRPGAAFPLIKKLLALNTIGTPKDRVEVILLSRNSPDAGIRVMKSVKHHGLSIDRAVFVQGSDRFRYAEAMGAHLFLSANPNDVRDAIQNGLAAATMMSKPGESVGTSSLVKIAFDGDSVLFSDEADEIFRHHGLEHFTASEKNNASVPLMAGPFKIFITEIAKLQKEYPRDELPIKIALVTARGMPTHERVLITLRSWGIRLDEAIFAAGRSKGPFLRAFGADIFFDDTMHNVDNALAHDIPTGHVPYGSGHGIIEPQINPEISLNQC